MRHLFNPLRKGLYGAFFRNYRFTLGILGENNDFWLKKILTGFWEIKLIRAFEADWERGKL